MSQWIKSLPTAMEFHAFSVRTSHVDSPLRGRCPRLSNGTTFAAARVPEGDEFNSRGSNPRITQQTIVRPCKGRIDMRPLQGRGFGLIPRSVGVAHGY